MAATEEIEKEILAEMAANPVPYAAGQVNDVITIDGETRMISVPASEIFFGVESDKDVERKHFRCPKVVGDGIDLSKHQIYISYITSDSAGKTFSGNAGLYLCEDVATDGDDITFSWQLSGNVFASAGFIAFKVLAAKTDGENVQTRWNTVPAIGTVLMTVPDGMDIGEAYPDIVTQLLERMASVEKIATEEAMQGYVNTYLEAHPGEIDETLTDPKKAAPASVVGELKGDLNSTNVAVFADSENIINSKKTHYNNNTALVNNNDGTYTVGTSDYGKTLFSGRLTLDPGVYYLYGVPNGYSFLSPDGHLSTAFVKNYTPNGVPVIITETTVCFIGFNIEPAPSASFTIAPYLKKDYISRLTSIVERNGKINNNANILNNDDVAYIPNKYYANGSYYINTDYSVFEINLKEGATYTFGCRMRFFYDVSESIASQTDEGYSYTSDANKKVFATVYNTDTAKWIVIKSPDLVANALPYGSIGLNPAVFANEMGGSTLKTMSQKAITDAINGVSTLPYYEQYKGNEQSYTLGTANSIKKNKVINFGCDFSTFGTLYIDLVFGTGNSIENRFAIDSTNLVRTVDGSAKPAVAHGITIQDHINVTVDVLITGIKLTIVSGGQSYSAEYNYANGSVRPSYSVSGMTISNVDFSWTCKDFKKDMWLFGDSYFSYGDNRWMYYLVEEGYANNCLIDAYPGESSQYSLPSLQSYIDLAKPKDIVWCVGMNDGGDTSSAPSAQWKNAVDAVIAICEEKGINLILATIPTVPSINHEKKNEFVRSSGYQYIDFAKAVGASSSGVWFDGMLATDNVHPTVAGAMALYRQALLDCPQLMISN